MPRRRSNEIRVYVIDHGREHLRLRYTDPVTGKPHYRTSGTSSRREAEKVAAVWQADINAKRWVPGERMAWAVFVDQYTKLALPALASTTEDSYSCILSTFGRLACPAYLDSITPLMLSEYATKLRNTPIVSPIKKIQKKRSETTIKDHLAVIHAALAWAVDQGWLDTLPKFPKIERARKSKKKPHKGRAITDVEFQAMLATAERVIDAPRVDAVKRILWLVRLIGFRISEALDFWWPDHPQNNHVTFGANGRPSLVIYSGRQKSNEDEDMPVTRAAGEWLLQTPKEDRVGRVAPWPGRNGNIGKFEASRQIAAIGEAAGIIVEPRSGKFASAHDVRRLCVTDWLRRFSPAVVQKLARHKSIETTMAFYAFLADEKTADDLWNETGAISGATD